jgi:hypothetical protein
VNGNVRKKCVKFDLSKTVFTFQFGKQLLVLGLMYIDFLTVFNQIRSLLLGCIGIGIGNKEEKADYQKNYKIGK